MKRVNFILASLILVFITSMISCRNDDNQPFDDPEAELTGSVKTDFHSRHQNRIIKSVYGKDNTFIIDFVNTNNTEKGEALYVDNVWSMTQIDYSELSELPEKVINSFNDRHSFVSRLNITKIDIKKFEKEYYNISFVKDTLNHKNLTYEVLINVDGDYLDKNYNISIKPHIFAMVSVTEAVRLLTNKYKDAKIRTFRYSDGIQYNILDDGISKYVTFNDQGDNKLIWEDTRYKVSISEVPDYVFEELELREPLFDATNVFCVEFVENTGGYYFIVRVGNILNNIGYYVNIR